MRAVGILRLEPGKFRAKEDPSRAPCVSQGSSGSGAFTYLGGLRDAGASRDPVADLVFEEGDPLVRQADGLRKFSAPDEPLHCAPTHGDTLGGVGRGEQLRLRAMGLQNSSFSFICLTTADKSRPRRPLSEIAPFYAARKLFIGFLWAISPGT